MLAVLVMEVNIRFREGGAARIEKTADVLLRYHYKPGHQEQNPGGGPPAQAAAAAPDDGPRLRPTSSRRR